MSSMRGGRVAVSMLIVTTVVSLASGSAMSSQGTVSATPFPQRSAPSSQLLGIAQVIAVVTLTDPPVNVVVAQATARGLSDLEIFALATVQWLRISGAQTRLMLTLAQPPFDALLVEQSVLEQNTITIQLHADQVSLIQALPGVLSVRVGQSTLPVLPTEEMPTRPEISPGTRLLPLQPPGYN